MRTRADAVGALDLLVGTDLVAVDHLAAMLAAQPGLAEQVFTPAELAYAARHRRNDEHLAARFAAKEAVFKALGTGLSRGVTWQDVEVVNGASGQPRLRLSGAAAVLADGVGVRRARVSLSHSAGLAIAFATMLCSPPPPTGSPPPPTVNAIEEGS